MVCAHVDVRAEIVCDSRWCVSCHRRPLCLHVDLLDLQLTNLSAALFSSLREALNIQRLCLSLAATDSCQLLGRKVCVCVLVSICLSLWVYISQVCFHLSFSVCACVHVSPALIWCLGRSIERWLGVRIIADLVGQSMTQRERDDSEREKEHTCPHTHTPCWEKYIPALNQTHLSLSADTQAESHTLCQVSVKTWSFCLCLFVWKDVKYLLIYHPAAADVGNICKHL